MFLKKEYIFLLLTVFSLEAVQPTINTENKEQSHAKHSSDGWYEHLSFPMIGASIGGVAGAILKADTDKMAESAAIGAILGLVVGVGAGVGSSQYRHQQNQHQLKLDLNDDIKESFARYYAKLSDFEKEEVPYVCVEHLVNKVR